jgi:hypothetical protein
MSFDRQPYGRKALCQQKVWQGHVLMARNVPVIWPKVGQNVCRQNGFRPKVVEPSIS